ncbi:MAG: DUF3043 domain-containing protein [Pseudonocardia sp.]
MRFLRRESETSADDAAQADIDEAAEAEAARVATHTPGKGRPTPKRREAQNKSRGPAPPPPRTQREAAKLAKANRGSRDERRAASADRRARMMAGDDRVLMPRDRGPARAFVRDVVDSRRHLMGLFMPLAALVFVSVLVPIPRVQSYLSLLCLLLLAAMVIEGTLLGRQVNAKVRERFPDTKTGFGLGWYAFTRASQIRKLRIPKPRVTYGENP